MRKFWAAPVNTPGQKPIAFLKAGFLVIPYAKSQTKNPQDCSLCLGGKHKKVFDFRFPTVINVVKKSSPVRSKSSTYPIDFTP